MARAPFILVDVSSSMTTPVPKNDMRPRIEILGEALTRILPEFPDARIIAFGDVVRELEGVEQEEGLALPEAYGHTPLHEALQLVLQKGGTDRLIILTDGLVDIPEATITAMRALAPCRVDAQHIGDEDDKVAIAFLRRLFLAGGTGRGSWGALSLGNTLQLTSELRRLLTDQRTREMGR